jgi:uridine kinase
MTPYLISIAGESGVGKTTIANIIEQFYGEAHVLRLSGDDLHKWNRHSDNWNKITHLNSEANNLELGDLHLRTLRLGKPIARSHYNHTTGEFDKHEILYSRPIVINEGLHAFYTDYSSKNSDFRIFVDACDELRCHWKIQRDIKDRGYTHEEVLKAIELRREDSTLLREKQIENADLIIKIETENPIENIGSDETANLKFSFNIKNQFGDDIVEHLKTILK